jgi:hypothetical protein
MKTAQEIKNRKLDILKAVVNRPRMSSMTNFGVEEFFRGTLGDIIFIDEREPDLEKEYEKITKKGLFTPQAVTGTLSNHFQNIEVIINEIASVYAEIAYNLGYLKLEKLLSPEDWNNIYKYFRDKCSNRDRYLEDIINQYGPPSLEIGVDVQPVHCYVSENKEHEWIFFDYWNEHLENSDNHDTDTYKRYKYSLDYKYRKNPILRNIRLPSKKFRHGIVFTPYGKQLIK